MFPGKAIEKKKIKTPLQLSCGLKTPRPGAWLLILARIRPGSAVAFAWTHRGLCPALGTCDLISSTRSSSEEAVVVVWVLGEQIRKGRFPGLARSRGQFGGGGLLGVLVGLGDLKGNAGGWQECSFPPFPSDKRLTSFWISLRNGGPSIFICSLKGFSWSLG